MKKRGLFIVLFITLLFIIPQTFSQADETELIDGAYWCLNSKVEGKCNSLSLDERIFSYLAIDECEKEILSAAKIENDGKCWPSTTCDLKTTSQAVIALSARQKNPNAIEDPLWWILSQTQRVVDSDITWLLQIESLETTQCTISWTGGLTNVRVNEDKTLCFPASSSYGAGGGLCSISGGGGCFQLYPGNYWLQILDPCKEKEFTIKCGTNFQTNLLYKKIGSSTIYVSGKTNSPDTNGETKEQVKASLCFGKNGVCNYEGTLWATLALSYAYGISSYGEEVNPTLYLPYLIANADSNRQFLPEAFLEYFNHGAYKTAIQNRQTTSKLTEGYWQGANGNLFDTALVLLLVDNMDASYYNKAKKWLTTKLDESNVGGCWDSTKSDIKDTAFILSSVWSDSIPYECTSDYGCDIGTGYVCNNKKCVEGCVDDTYCPIPKICDIGKTNKCVNPPECTIANELTKCPLEYVCGTNETCIAGCRNNNDAYCDITLGHICIKGSCIDGCRNDSQCEDRKICTSSNVCVIGCRDDRGEKGCDAGYICNDKNTCVKGCRINDDCGEGLICSKNLTCVKGCKGDTECGTGKICEPGSSGSMGCVAGCRDNIDCGNGKVCTTDHKCVECISTECPVREKCIANDCISKDWDCEGDKHCLNPPKIYCEDHKCVVCIYKSDCPTGVCSSNNTCVECVANSECDEGYACNKTNNKCEKLPDCVKDIDCKDPKLKCVKGFCISDSAECYYDFECVSLYGDDYVCNNQTNKCVKEPECDDLLKQCKEGYACINGNCVLGDECEFNSDCNDNEICDTNGDCVPKEEKLACEKDKNYFCRSKYDCESDGGAVYTDYTCTGLFKCCSKGEQLKTCSEEGGVKCSSSQTCSGGINIYSVSDLSSGQSCCVGGTCQSGYEISECENAGGICRQECYSYEDDSYEECDSSSQVCCFESVGGCTSDSDCTGGKICDENGNCVIKPSPNYLWLWILLILIVLVVLGIIFRSKLSPLLFRVKSMFGGGKSQRRPGFPPPSPMMERPMPMMPRRILPPQPPRGPMAAKKPAPKPKGELDDVLKKLKEIGK